MPLALLLLGVELLLPKLLLKLLLTAEPPKLELLASGAAAGL
jgi:hypothetical protein